MALRQLGDEKIPVADTAIGFTTTEYVTATGTPLNVIMAVCTVETAPLRINCYGTPTAAGAEGSALKNPGDIFEVIGYDDIKRFLAIRSGSVSGVLMVQFFGVP